MSEDDYKMMSADDHMFKNTAYLVYIILYILFRIGKSIENNFDTSCKVVIL